jgi:hypothetical protein
MTVTSTTYSSIEEAWADNYLSPSLQKKPKKKRSDPICELYENGYAYPHYSQEDSDIVSYANKYFDKYNKSKYQKSKMHTREKQPKHVEISPDYDLPLADADIPPRDSKQVIEKYNWMPDEDEDDDDFTQPHEHKEEYEAEPPRPRRAKHREAFDDEDFQKEYCNTGFNHSDLALYVVSGIIMIFMMEQFVKIGVSLR